MEVFVLAVKVTFWLSASCFLAVFAEHVLL